MLINKTKRKKNCEVKKKKNPWQSIVTGFHQASCLKSASTKGSLSLFFKLKQQMTRETRASD